MIIEYILLGTILVITCGCCCIPEIDRDINDNDSSIGVIGEVDDVIGEFSDEFVENGDEIPSVYDV